MKNTVVDMKERDYENTESADDGEKENISTEEGENSLEFFMKVLSESLSLFYQIKGKGEGRISGIWRSYGIV